MRLSIEWLRDLVEFDITPEELNLRLTMIGLEVEGVESVEGDIVFEVNVTPNRSDCLSVLGIAREVSALLNVPLKMPNFKIAGDLKDCDLTVEIVDPDLCHRYAGREIKGVRVSESPEWLKKRLERSGMRPINNIVDVTNYVLLEMGHPLHAFDADLIEGRVIRVGRAGKGQSLKTIDGVERTAPEDSLLIWDSRRPIAIAGIMGGKESEVTDRTVNVFLESAYFLPSSIRRTSKALGLRTESSYRFERGTDKEALLVSLDRAAYLICELAGGEVSKRVDVYPVLLDIKPIIVRYERVRKIIGAEISNAEMTDILQRLGMKIQIEENHLSVIPPTFRNDIKSEIDIIEEIARFYGYDRIPVTVPKIPVSRGKAEKSQIIISSIRDSMRKLGFNEAINYSFLNTNDLDMMKIPAEDIRRRALKIKNPLRTEDSHLRTTVLPALIRNLRYNLSVGNREVRLFEIARVFQCCEGEIPVERHHLGAIYYVSRLHELWKDETPKFYIFKGFIQHLMSELRIKDILFERSAEPFLHPGQAADIFVSKNRIGFFGLLHPDIVDQLDIKLAKPEVYLCEIDLDLLVSFVTEGIRYSPLPRFPYIDRDIAILVDESIAAASLMTAIKGFPSELIEDVSIFDEYKGINIPKGKKSLAFTIRYRSKERTLTDEVVDSVHRELIQYLCEKTGGIIRT